MFFVENHQLRPDFVPIVGPKVSAGDGALGGALDLHSALLRYSAAIDPARHDRLRDADGFPESGVGKTLFAQVGREFHAPTIADSFTVAQ